ncbi:MAG: nicotinate-nucleotide--dimethylbenzimidazole phosphoribosyltransferase [Candidatus Binatus sp.]|uniref:nicotinate-nucleotide--dimethylbenzimidazole phosphoribosyltransferase n=1 Tax=Candidatus Binatus sp. TaxID=2811406 RepID=UPI0027288CDC|nr:nicotinate-nucleotide--dimethylbenzimidazole phosphoribosyltransferase [Candidatus Binatus sp.]MDO8430875.1 nicotinate-nucleotide--dimethylbenzimidazole phosphoribosyltransferase [Candidatus Binatus sp.]
MSLLNQTIAAIRPLDNEAAWAADARLNSLTKPPGSLGHLEEIVRRYASIRRDSSASFTRGAIAVFVADHGVADENVSAFPQAVTVEMLRNLSNGGAAICVLARRFGYALKIIDVGVRTDTSATPLRDVSYRRIGAGTQNFTSGPAMTHAQATRALETGIEVARELAGSGASLIGIGEMGIANSTSAAALLSAITEIAPDQIVGRGTGLDDAGIRHKIEVVAHALEIHRDTFESRDDAGLAILVALGGFEIAAMAGVCLAGASLDIPVVVDGFIATAAAAVALQFYPRQFEHLFFSHRSSEGGHALVLDHLKVRPILDLDLRLGEGTGAALAMNLIESALDLFHHMATFAGAGVSDKIR